MGLNDESQNDRMMEGWKEQTLYAPVSFYGGGKTRFIVNDSERNVNYIRTVAPLLCNRVLQEIVKSCSDFFLLSF